MDAPSTASLAPNDTMRNGIATVKSELSFVHPVQPMQANVSAHTRPPRSQLSLLRPRPPSLPLGPRRPGVPRFSPRDARALGCTDGEGRREAAA